MHQVTRRPDAAALNSLTTRADLDAFVAQHCPYLVGRTTGLPDHGVAGMIVENLVGPGDEAELRAAVDLIERFMVPGGRLVFDGYTTIDCEGSAPRYVWECVTHYLAEAVGSHDAPMHLERYRALFERCYPEHEGAEV